MLQVSEFFEESDLIATESHFSLQTK